MPLYYLNYDCLSSDKIIQKFQQMNINDLGKFKSTLKSVFFGDQNISDQAVLGTLEADERFKSNYPKLKQVLQMIFASTEDKREETVKALNAITAIDWDTTTAQKQFDALNEKHGYFKEPSEHLRNLFADLAVACRTQIVLFEKNNTRDDTMAYDYAYKLMALYVDPEKPEKSTMQTLSTQIYKLMNNIDTNKRTPFYEALQVKLKDLPPADSIVDRAGWREFFIKIHQGVKAIPFFLMADKIETKIAEQKTAPRRAPKTLEEANDIAMFCQYDRAAEDPEFAKLCHQYNVPVTRFNRCLDYLQSGWPKKVSDSIPDCSTESGKYYWVKLPAEDKRALILGNITDCCLSITEEFPDSEQCVKDAVSLDGCGMYVLVQGKKNNPLIRNGKINDKDFKIIGQAYAWKSSTGNLCLDSIECLRNAIPDTDLKKTTSAWAKNLLENNKDIKFVTLGRGGKTPENLFPEAMIPEVIAQGTQYKDSVTQYCIASSQKTLDETQRNKLNALLQPYDEPFKQSIEYLTYYLPHSDNLVEELENLLRQDPEYANHLDSESLFRFLALKPSPRSMDDFAPVDLNALEKMNPEERKAALKDISTARLVWKETTVEGLLSVIQYVPENERLQVIATMVLSQDRFCSFPQIWWSGWDELLIGHHQDALISLLDSLSEADQLKLSRIEGRAGKTLLEAATYSRETPALLSKLLDLYKDQVVDALNRTDRYGCKVLRNFLVYFPVDLHNKYLKFFSEEQLFTAVKEKSRSGEPLLFHAKADVIINILNQLSPEHRLEVLMQTSTAQHYKGRTVIEYSCCRNNKFTASHMTAILNSMPDDEARFTVLCEASSNIKNNDSLLAVIPENLRKRLDEYYRANDFIRNESIANAWQAIACTGYSIHSWIDMFMKDVVNDYMKEPGVLSLTEVLNEKLKIKLAKDLASDLKTEDVLKKAGIDEHTLQGLLQQEIRKAESWSRLDVTKIKSSVLDQVNRLNVDSKQLPPSNITFFKSRDGKSVASPSPQLLVSKTTDSVDNPNPPEKRVRPKST